MRGGCSTCASSTPSSCGRRGSSCIAASYASARSSCINYWRNCHPSRCLNAREHASILPQHWPNIIIWSVCTMPEIVCSAAHRMEPGCDPVSLVTTANSTCVQGNALHCITGTARQTRPAALRFAARWVGVLVQLRQHVDGAGAIEVVADGARAANRNLAAEVVPALQRCSLAG